MCVNAHVAYRGKQECLPCKQVQKSYLIPIKYQNLLSAISLLHLGQQRSVCESHVLA